MLEKRPLRKSDVNYACKITNAATEMNSRTGEYGQRMESGQEREPDRKQNRAGW